MSEPDYMAASRHAAEIARWAMFRQGMKADTPSVSLALFNDLSDLAAALGYRIVRADAELESDD